MCVFLQKLGYYFNAYVDMIYITSLYISGVGTKM